MKKISYDKITLALTTCQCHKIYIYVQLFWAQTMGETFIVNNLCTAEIERGCGRGVGRLAAEAEHLWLFF